MTLVCWMIIVCLGLVSALNPVPHQMNEESLRSALNAVTRKQRSVLPNYYVDLPPIKYREDNGDRKLQRRQVVNDEIDDNEESLAFIPSEGTGQLETIGDGYQHLSNKQFGRALMDYLQYNTDQDNNMAVQSAFRERERSGSRKRGGNLERDRIDGKELAQLLLENIESDSLDDDQRDDKDYQKTLELLSDKYKNLGDNNNIYSDDQLLLNELLNEEDRDEEQDPRFAQFQSAERRNVNARYPLFNREYKTYRDMSKRFPVSKRSAKSMNKKRQVTDPKVAQDLGALFGTLSTESVNHTHDHDHDHDHDHENEHNHDHDHSHEHNHDHDHSHEHNHDHDHAKSDIHAEHVHDHTSESRNLKEIAGKVNKTKERMIDVKKKSVDWSQYFGIDRRKKKAVYMAKPGTQDQDDEYLIQKHYEIMAEHLNPTDKDGSEKRDKLQQMDAKLKNMKNLMIEEAVQVGSKNSMDNQEVKDEIMSRLAAAYSLEKLRRALNRLSNSATSQRESQKSAQAQNNLTSNHPTGAATITRNEDKRNRNSIGELQNIDEDSSCPIIDIFERHCKATERLMGDFGQMLHGPCVMYHICRSCDQGECLEKFALEAEKICQEKNLDESSSFEKYCMQTAMLLPRYLPSLGIGAMCRSVSCLARFQNRYQQRYLYNYPYAFSSKR